MSSWMPKSDPWNQKSIELLLSICSASPAMIVINPKKDETFWNPAGTDTKGPAKVTYTQINDDITIHIERKVKKVKK